LPWTPIAKPRTSATARDLEGDRRPRGVAQAGKPFDVAVSSELIQHHTRRHKTCSCSNSIRQHWRER
jgi:hypothetical protein